MSNKILDKVKYFIGLDDLEEEYTDIEEIEEEDSTIEVPSKRRTNKSNRVVNIHTKTQMKLVIHEPTTYEESPRIVDDLKNRRAVVINLETLDLELKKQIFEFINGAIYSLEGNIQKVAKDIFILAPNNIEIDGNIREELKNKGLFPWTK